MKSKLLLPELRPHLLEKIAHFASFFSGEKEQLIEHMWSPQHQSLLPFTLRGSISQKVVIYGLTP